MKRLNKLPQNIKDLFIKILVPQCLGGDLFFTKALRRSEIVSVGSIFFLLTLVGQTTFAQIELAPIWRTPPPNTSFKKQIPNARTSAALNPMLLPFWDDFSLNKFDLQNNTSYPNDTLWEYSQRVWVNDHMGINPPSIYVATFDGYDSLGRPYAKNDILAKGFADRMTSRPLRLDLVSPTDRPNVFINFFYQFQGNGEPPDAGDVLYLFFKDNSGVWNQIWQIENDGSLDRTKFVEVKIPISDPKFFHGKFQFKFQNFGRISGPYDTWNVDYVYVSNGKSQYNPVYRDFPDRTIVSGLTSLFKEYQSIPAKHFRTNANALLQQPSFVITNQRKDQTASFGPQPYSYSASAKVFSKKNKITTTTSVTLANNQFTGRQTSFGAFDRFTIPALPAQLTAFDSGIDSMIVDLKCSIVPRDNTLKKNNGAPDDGDYDSIVYKRINFRNNDTTRARYVLDNYYAYDDGTAEYGARINGIGTQLAYEFNLKTTNADTLVAIDYCFPPFGDESSQSVQFHVLSALTGQDADYLYRKNTSIKRLPNSGFVRETLASPVLVQGKFYIGWRLLSDALITVGLDRSFDSGEKMFVNSAGDWQQNTTLKGSLMIRPVFIRKGQAPAPVSVVDEPIHSVYPNPNDGTFFLPPQTTRVVVFDVTGRPVGATLVDGTEKIEVVLNAPTQGIYVVKYFNELRWYTSKVWVKP